MTRTLVRPLLFLSLAIFAAVPIGLVQQNVVPIDFDLTVSAWLGLLPSAAFLLLAVTRTIPFMPQIGFLRALIMALFALSALNIVMESPDFALLFGGLSALTSGAVLQLAQIARTPIDPLFLAGGLVVLALVLFVPPEKRVAEDSDAPRVPRPRRLTDEPVTQTRSIEVERVAETLPWRSSLRITPNQVKLSRMMKTIREEASALGGEIVSLGQPVSGPLFDVVPFEARGLDAQALRLSLETKFGRGCMILKYGPVGYVAHVPAERRGVVPIRQGLDGIDETSAASVVALGVDVEGEPFLVDCAAIGSLGLLCRDTDEMRSFALAIGLSFSRHAEPARVSDLFASPEALADEALALVRGAIGIAYRSQDLMSRVDVVDAVDQRMQARARGVHAGDPIFAPFVLVEPNAAVLETLDHVLRYGPDVSVYPLVFATRPEKLAPFSIGGLVQGFASGGNRLPPEIRHLLPERDYLYTTRSDKIRFHGAELSKREELFLRERIRKNSAIDKKRA